MEDCTVLLLEYEASGMIMHERTQYFAGLDSEPIPEDFAAKLKEAKQSVVLRMALI